MHHFKETDKMEDINAKEYVYSLFLVEGNMSRIRFMNTEVDNFTMDEAIEAIDRLIQQDKNSYVVTPNIDHIVRLETDENLQRVYANADIILTDGKPMIWMSKLYGTPIKEKVSGSDLFPRLCKLATEKNYRVFLLGAAEGVAVKAASNLQKKFPGLMIAGTYSPPFGFEKDEEEIQHIIQIVTAAKPHILIVGLGCPKQENFIYNYRNELKVPVSLGLGASIDFEAGILKRAPKWMADHGFEWLYRVVQDPKRMAKRYFVDDAKIIRLFFKYRPK